MQHIGEKQSLEPRSSQKDREGRKEEKIPPA
jgi:hypothetical protein